MGRIKITNVAASFLLAIGASFSGVTQAGHVLDTAPLRQALKAPQNKPTNPLVSYRHILPDVAVHLFCDRDNQRAIVGLRHGGAFSLDLATGKTHAYWQASPRNTRILAVSPNGKVAVTSGGNHAPAVFWQLETGTELLQTAHIKGFSAAFSPDGRYAFLGESTKLHILDTDTGQLHTRNLGTGGVFTALAVTADSQHLVVLRGVATVQRYRIDWADGSPSLTPLKAARRLRSRDILKMAITPDQQHIDIGTKNDRVFRVTLPDMTVAETRYDNLKQHFSADFFPPDKFLVTGKTTPFGPGDQNLVLTGRHARGIEKKMLFVKNQETLACYRSADSHLVLNALRMATTGPEDMDD